MHQQLDFFCAKVCCASYISEARCRDELRDDGLTDIAMYKTPGAFAFAGRHRNQAVLAFRGSDQCRDLLGGAFSLGFRWHGVYHEMFRRLWAQIDPKFFTDSLTITGHSQGGAFALFASLLMNPRQCITFGCPAVFGPTTLRKYRTPTTRYVHGNDVVPSLFPGYQHVGKLKRLKGNGGRIEDHKIINYVKAMR